VSRVKKLTTSKKTKTKGATILYIFVAAMFVSTAISLFKSNYSQLVLKLIGFVMLLGSAKLIDMGLANEQKYNSSKIAYAPKMKYKLFGYILLGVAIFYLNFLVGKIGLVYSLINATIAFVGALMYYGQDPFKDKLPSEDGINYEKLIKELQEAQEKLDSIKKDEEEIKDYALKTAIQEAVGKAQDIIDAIKEDPKDRRVARKFMVIYLDGIKDVISQYKSIDKELLDSSFRERLIELLDSATQRFENDLNRLKSNEIFDLDVQIDSLKKQLK